MLEGQAIGPAEPPGKRAWKNVIQRRVLRSFRRRCHNTLPVVTVFWAVASGVLFDRTGYIFPVLILFLLIHTYLSITPCGEPQAKHKEI